MSKPKLYRLRSMVELMRASWTIREPLPGKIEKSLVKPGCHSIPESRWIYLGKQLLLTYDPRRGFVDESLFIWSKKASQNSEQ